MPAGLMHETTVRQLAQTAPATLLEAVVADPPLSDRGFLRVELVAARGSVLECPWLTRAVGDYAPVPGDAVAVEESNGGNFWAVGLWPKSGVLLPGGAAVAWADITGKPATFPPSPHGHALADVAGLTDALAAKADAAATSATLASLQAQIDTLAAALADTAPAHPRWSDL